MARLFRILRDSYSSRLVRNTFQAGVLLTLPTIIILLLCVEALLRFVGYTPYYLDHQAFIPSRNPQILYELKPGFRGLYAGVPVAINAMGFREHEQPNGHGMPAVRILTVGDSISFGQGVSDGETLAEQIKKKWQEWRAPIEVYNLGVPGYDTCQEYWLYKERGVQIRHDVVIHIYYENDTDPPLFRVNNGIVISPDSQNGTFHAWARKSLVAYNLVWTRWQVLKHRMNTTDGYTKILATKFSDKNPGWERSKACLRDIVSLARTYSARVIVIPFPVLGFLNEKPYPLNAYIQSVCSEAETNGAECLDVVSFLQQFDIRLTVNSVEDHPSAQVYEKIADRVLKVIGQT